MVYENPYPICSVCRSQHDPEEACTREPVARLGSVKLTGDDARLLRALKIAFDSEEAPDDRRTEVPVPERMLLVFSLDGDFCAPMPAL